MAGGSTWLPQQDSSSARQGVGHGGTGSALALHARVLHANYSACTGVFCSLYLASEAERALPPSTVIITQRRGTTRSRQPSAPPTWSASIRSAAARHWHRRGMDQARDANPPPPTHARPPAIGRRPASRALTGLAPATRPGLLADRSPVHARWPARAPSLPLQPSAAPPRGPLRPTAVAARPRSCWYQVPARPPSPLPTPRRRHCQRTRHAPPRTGKARPRRRSPPTNKSSSTRAMQ